MITGKTIKGIIPALVIMATTIGATWILLEKIKEFRVESDKKTRMTNLITLAAAFLGGFFAVLQFFE